MNGKKVILGISGSIAAYKAAFLTRLLIKAGAEVQVLMTEAATQFISPLTLSTLSKRTVHTQVSAEESWNNHVEMGLWADVMLVAPATATTLGKMANAICDNIIVATYLSARCPICVAPAMDLDMWHHPATQHNTQRLLSYGNHLIPVGHGELASGLVGDGRMAEPPDILDYLQDLLSVNDVWRGKKVLITAGPTHEPLDPVRYLGNRSSGKMGVAIAKAAAARGAEVQLILGPSNLSDPAEVSTTRVQTAQEMYEVAQRHFPDTDVAIMAAAVADYRPKHASAQKIKKKSDALTLELVPNPDIAASLGQQKKPGQILVGFALETTDGLSHAQGKLRRKNLDLIVLNSLADPGAGFQHDTNKVSIIGRNNKTTDFELKSKREVAMDILDAIEALETFSS